MQFYASKILGQFASEKLGQFDWILQWFAKSDCIDQLIPI
jgi:hypothetical protein